MRRIWTWSLVLLIAGSTAWAAEDKEPATAPPGADKPKGDKPPEDNPKTPEEQLNALKQEFQNANTEFTKAVEDVRKEAADKGEDPNAYVRKNLAKLLAKQPKPQTFAPKFLKVAQEHPKDPAAFAALEWIITNAQTGDSLKQAIEIVLKDHLQNPKLGEIAQRMVYLPSPMAEKLLREVAAGNKNRDTQGKTYYALARYLKRQGETIRALKDEQPGPRLTIMEMNLGKETVAKMKATDSAAFDKEVETLFERVHKEYPDVATVWGKLGDVVESELYEIRHLSIGKVAPDIEGEDTDGKPFKLSDYRGKVVVIDFWGHW